jgi:hypothetical protein
VRLKETPYFPAIGIENSAPMRSTTVSIDYSFALFVDLTMG